MHKKIILDQLKKFMSDEEGQSTTEYILILAVVLMVALKFKTSFSTQMGKLSDKVGAQMEEAVNVQ